MAYLANDWDTGEEQKRVIVLSKSIAAHTYVDVRARLDNVRLLIYICTTELMNSRNLMSIQNKPLTHRQQEVLDFVRNFTSQANYPPTRRDIADQFGFRSLNAAEEHLKSLERKGMLDIDRKVSRGIRLRGQSLSGLQVIGRVAAGSPIEAIEHVEQSLEICPALFHPKADYLLRVRGDSMINAGIFEDDLVAVHKTTEVRDGQIVVARVADEVTVKRFEKLTSPRYCRLMPENPNHEPILVDMEQGDFAIEGVSVGILRLSS